MSDKKDTTALAEDRTDWAEDRTLLANERTFAGWMRTGMACVALALGLRALFGAVEPGWIARSAASLLILVSLFIFFAAWVSARNTLDRLEDHTAYGQPQRRIAIIAALLGVSAATTGVLLWFL
jgi:putative membrane protein